MQAPKIQTKMQLLSLADNIYSFLTVA